MHAIKLELGFFLGYHSSEVTNLYPWYHVEYCNQTDIEMTNLMTIFVAEIISLLQF